LQCPQIDGKYTPPMAEQLMKQYGWRVHTMNELMVLCYRNGGATLMKKLFFLVMRQKLELAAT
jgi:hypothetical protein